VRSFVSPRVIRYSTVVSLAMALRYSETTTKAYRRAEKRVIESQWRKNYGFCLAIKIRRGRLLAKGQEEAPQEGERERIKIDGYACR